MSLGRHNAALLDVKPLPVQWTSSVRSGSGGRLVLNVFCVEGSGKVIKALKATIVACEQRRVKLSQGLGPQASAR